MVEVIQLHSYKDSYPFGLQKQTDCTYVQLIKQLPSQTEFLTYKHNLALFKSLPSDLFIPLDSYIKQGSTLQMYYHYEPLSIKLYIEERLLTISQDHREKFLTRVITAINIAIQDVISLLTSHHILALLSIDNIAMGKAQKIKFFIEPDFQYLQLPSPNQIHQYYNTQKKKLQIQLEQFLQQIFSFTTQDLNLNINTNINLNSNMSNKQSKEPKKPNFLIQGTKLVFLNDQQTKRQSNMSVISGGRPPIPGNVPNTTNGNINININSTQTLNSAQTIHQHKHQIKLPAYMLKQPKEPKEPKQLKEAHELPSINNNSKQKFDIKNILDQKKLQKNQLHTKQSPNSDKIHSNLNLDKTPLKHQLAQTSDQTQNKNNEKDIKNYFENNDDFNKDASFYPEQFIKEDSIAQFQGYEDELEKQLEDLKLQKYQAQQLANTSKNRLSMVPNTPITPQIIDPKTNKTPQPQSKSTKNPNFPQNVLNSSDSRQNDTSQQQQKQKKKYKVTITTSHLVDLQDQHPDLKTIEQQLIQDIKKGSIKHNPETSGSQHFTHQLKGNSDKQIMDGQNIPTHLLKNNTRETHYQKPQQTSAYHQISSNSQKITSNTSQQHSTQERTFSKQLHPHISSDTSTFLSHASGNKDLNQYSSGNFTLAGSSTSSNQQAPDIKKIIEKIKNNSQNHQFIHLSQNPGSNTHQNVPVKLNSQHGEQLNLSQKQVVEQESRPQSQISGQGSQPSSNNSIPPNSDRKDQQKEYYDKIQKAKMKAEEIMKLVKERKGQ